jgi:surface polysaccharide O-acyltransferase-like enzyme
MQKPRLPAIEYIRGISMLGVIGIHVGSQYLSNTSANIHLIALFEIVSRFSVPIFFFISAFGLFYNMDINKVFNYKAFMLRRFRTVLIPYLIWSFFYLLHDDLLYHTGFPSIPSLFGILFFGNAKYQLYFLVILLWFYLLMPLWLYMVRHATWKNLTLLFILQIAFDYFSSFNTTFNLMVYSIENPYLKPFLLYRLNYWVLHYTFIFVVGGYLAVHIEAFLVFMQKRRTEICLFFWISMAALTGYYYRLLFYKGYTLEEAVNTAHQLCPAGIFYTLAASLFFFTIFTYQKFPKTLNPLLSLLGRHSYFAYLVHPVAITYLALLLEHYGRIMTAPIAIVFYCVVILLAISAGMFFRKLGQHWPIVNILTIGIYPKKK